MYCHVYASGRKTCKTCILGWGRAGWGDVDVRENLPHFRMPRNFLGGVGWGDVDVLENLRHFRMLRNFLGGVRWGDVDVRGNLRHFRMLRNFLGGVGWGDVDVRENLRHFRMLRNFFGGVGWGDVDVRENLRHFRMLRILASEALTCVKQSPTNPALLLTDGAPCYRSLSAKFGWRHEACSHSKGIFCIKKRIKTKRS